MTTKRAYTAGNFLFTIDDPGPDTCWLRSVEGGTVKGSVIDERVGPDHIKFKHLSTVEIEPITVQVGLSATSPFFKWIQESWTHTFSRRDGAIIHADGHYKAMLEQSFLQALIVETTFPTLDGSDKSPAYLTVKLQPEYLEIKEAGGEDLQATMTAKQKLWTPSSFRLNIDGLDCSHVNKIESLTVKQNVKPMYIGDNRYPELEPTGIEFPTITLTVAAAFAKGFIDWHRDFVIRGDKEHRQEKTGSIEFLDPTGDDSLPLFTIDLQRIGINSLSIEKSEAGSDGIKRCKVELYVEAMELKFGLGLE